MGDFVIEIIKELFVFFWMSNCLIPGLHQRISVMPQTQTKPLQN